MKNKYFKPKTRAELQSFLAFAAGSRVRGGADVWKPLASTTPVFQGALVSLEYGEYLPWIGFNAGGRIECLKDAPRASQRFDLTVVRQMCYPPTEACLSLRQSGFFLCAYDHVEAARRRIIEVVGTFKHYLEGVELHVADTIEGAVLVPALACIPLSENEANALHNLEPWHEKVEVLKAFRGLV